MEIYNRKAKHDYFIDEQIECGIVLTGTEIKSVREGSCNIKDSYAIIKNGECFILNMFIAPYKQGNIFNHEETRTRQLLLHKKEIKKLEEKVKLKGLTLVPLKIYFTKGHAKMLLGVCRGRKSYDKRNLIKERDIQREVAKKMKNY